jgi:hypothetical protein
MKSPEHLVCFRRVLEEILNKQLTQPDLERAIKELVWLFNHSPDITPDGRTIIGFISWNKTLSGSSFWKRIYSADNW